MEVVVSHPWNVSFKKAKEIQLSLSKKVLLKPLRKKIRLIAMLNEEMIREKIKKHEIITLTESVQKFYNGPCAGIEILDNKNLDEIIDLLVEIQA